MDIQSLQQKNENLSALLKELTNENEALFHQYNHLIIRNNKLLKRIDDQQQMIEDMHLRIEELQLIHGNLLKINDNYRKGLKNSFGTAKVNDDYVAPSQEDLLSKHDVDSITERWRNYPEQQSQNKPNLRKQVVMLLNLYVNGRMRAYDLFNLTAVGGVTGARYVSILKKVGMVTFNGAPKKGFYEITSKGIEFLDNINQPAYTPLIDQLPKTKSNTLKVKAGINIMDHTQFDSMDL